MGEKEKKGEGRRKGKGWREGRAVVDPGGSGACPPCSWPGNLSSNVSSWTCHLSFLVIGNGHIWQLHQYSELWKRLSNGEQITENSSPFTCRQARSHGWAKGGRAPPRYTWVPPHAWGGDCPVAIIDRFSSFTKNWAFYGLFCGLQICQKCFGGPHCGGAHDTPQISYSGADRMRGKGPCLLQTMD